eukprot:scaffold343437_cov90-Attheya_sp.AAC.1
MGQEASSSSIHGHQVVLLLVERICCWSVYSILLSNLNIAVISTTTPTSMLLLVDGVKMSGLHCQ